MSKGGKEERESVFGSGRDRTASTVLTSCQVLINYGQLTNAELLLQYGFLMEGNPLDGRMQSVRQQLLSTPPQELLTRYEVSVGELEGVEDAGESLVAEVRQCLEWEALLAVGLGDLHSGGAEKKATYLRGQEKNLHKCIGVLQKSLDDCSTTVEQDRQLLASRSLTPNQILAVNARLEEKERAVKAAISLHVKALFGQSFVKATSPHPDAAIAPTLSMSPTPSVSSSTAANKSPASDTFVVSPSRSVVTSVSVSVTPTVTPIVTPQNEKATEDTYFNSAIANAPQSAPSEAPTSGRAMESTAEQGREHMSPESRERLARVERLRAQQNLMNKLRTELNSRPEEESVIVDAVWRPIPGEEESATAGYEHMHVRYQHNNSTTIALLVATISTEDIVSALELPLISVLTESFVSTLCKSTVTDNCHRQPTIVNGEYSEQERSRKGERRMSESRRERLEANREAEPRVTVGSEGEGEGERASEEFTFVFYIGFDEGDPFYDSEYNMRQMSAAFSVLSRKYPGVHFHIFRHKDTKGKPSWVWNQLANIAYHDGCEYLFQVNDDMRFLTADWAPYLVAQLRHSPLLPNFGVTGPKDIRRNLLTQAFVHRSHLDLFKVADLSLSHSLVPPCALSLPLSLSNSVSLSLFSILSKLFPFAFLSLSLLLCAFPFSFSPSLLRDCPMEDC